MHTSDDPSWLLYPNTILEFHTSTSFTIDLREALTSRARDSLCANHLDQPFAVITACNPRGHRHSDVDNVLLTRQLETYLRKRGLQMVRVDGLSPDRAHRESGVALKLTKEEARNIANQYHQSAFFWFD